MTPYNHNDVVSHSEPVILECEVRASHPGLWSRVGLRKHFIFSQQSLVEGMKFQQSYLKS